jgi:uncharacterized protein with NRDE domain
MCTLFLSYKSHSKYKLILLHNRDEFYNRPSVPLHWWDDIPTILAGRDLQRQGTWLGVSNQGKIAAITNYREMEDVTLKTTSRGDLVKDFLAQEADIQDFTSYLKDNGSEFSGFNLLYGTVDNLFYFTNKAEMTRTLLPGNYGLSNAFLDTPWTKVRSGKNVFERLVSLPQFDSEAAFEIMLSTERSPDNELPDTGFGIDNERFLSSRFIESSFYGTMTTSLVLVDHENNVSFEERTHVPKQQMQSFHFRF